MRIVYILALTLACLMRSPIADAGVIYNSSPAGGNSGNLLVNGSFWFEYIFPFEVLQDIHVDTISTRMYVQSGQHGKFAYQLYRYSGSTGGTENGLGDYIGAFDFINDTSGPTYDLNLNAVLGAGQYAFYLHRNAGQTPYNVNYGRGSNDATNGVVQQQNVTYVRSNVGSSGWKVYETNSNALTISGTVLPSPVPAPASGLIFAIALIIATLHTKRSAQA